MNNYVFLEEFTCHWGYKIDNSGGLKMSSVFKKSDINLKERVIDIIFEDAVQVKAN